MKRLKLSLLFLCSFNLLTTGQNFLNGDVESTDLECHLNISNSSFNSYLQNCFGFGTAQQLDIVTNNCGFGEAKSGEVFLGVSVFLFSDEYDAFSLSLDENLQPGKEYELTFFKRLAECCPGNQMEIGYSNDSLSFGNLIDTVMGASSVELWDSVSLIFIPTIEAKYITLRVALDIDGGNFVDAFSIKPTGFTSVIEPNSDFELSVFPNPASDDLNIFLSKKLSNSTIEINTLSGVKVLQKHFENLKEASIDISELESGFYFISVKGAKSIGTIKFLILS